VNLLGTLRRRPRLNIIAFTVTVLATVGTLDVADLWWRHDQALQQAQSRSRNLSVVLAEYVRGSFVAADAALRQIAVHNRRAGGATAASDGWDSILAAAHAALPEVGSFTITDRAGTITHSTVPAIVGASRRDDYVFKRLAAANRDELMIDRPFLTVTTPRRYVIPIGRPLLDARGAFEGAVVASIVPDSYRAFFRTLDLGEGGVLTVLHPDGVVLFREPSAGNPINEAAADNALLQRARESANGGFDGPIQPNGPSFVSTYRTVANPPLIVSVSLRRSDVLANWYRQRRVAALAYGALALTLSAIVVFLFRVVAERERAERELAEIQGRESERLRLANDRLADALDRAQLARREIEAASTLKDEFLMTVSHELRTPLTAIYGWVRVLASREMPPLERSKALAAIERNALAQTRLIDDLLDVSRAITGKIRLEARPVDVGGSVRAAVETLTPAATAKHLQVDVVIDPAIEPIAADPDRLQQIVWNLVSNAIKFTPEGGRIEVRAGRADDAHVEIVVKDTGIGISSQFLPFVFERFRQADAGTLRRYGGLGLGLAIVRHLVELHGGSVAVQSAGENSGATFRVLLPATRPADAMSTLPTMAPQARRSGAGRLDGVRVLVVDDEKDSRELFEEVLNNAGARVVAVSSGSEALTQLKGSQFDALVSDIEMPIMDGYELVRLVRADPAIERQRLVAIALTAYARAVDRRRALEAGFDDHVAKPIDPGALVAGIGALLTAP
jgi:signal transduction histidine kinase/CheY-like chemotaxis protein